MNKVALKAKVTSALRKGIKGSQSSLAELVPDKLTAGKIYEAYVLGLVCGNLRTREGLTCTLVGATRLTLKSSPGPINSSYPHIRVTKAGSHVADIWTDIEFTALSAVRQGKSSLTQGEYHEMDIAIVAPNCQARPRPNEVYLAVECKNTGYQKRLLREILGVRRELSFHQQRVPTFFAHWPRSEVPADPPSCIAVYSTDPDVVRYKAPGAFFGVDFFHQPL
jgi:hypothetical protein